MPINFVDIIGIAASACATLSYIPQIRKVWPAGSTGDLSLWMLVALALGLALWVVYGAMKQDWVLVGSNILAVSLVGIVLGCKLRDLRGGKSKPANA